MRTHLPPKATSSTNHAKTYIAEASRWSHNHPNHTIEPVTDAAKGFVVVADDNADMREFIGRLLQNSGYTVSLAVDGLDAWEICQQKLPDLLISDVMMPRMNGFDLLKKIRSAEYTYTLPIILLSARAGNTDKAQGLTFGADDYLSKPFHSGELIARVDGAVKLGRYRKKAHEQLLAQTNHIAKVGGWSFDVETKVEEWTDELLRIHDLDINEHPIQGLEFYTETSRPIIQKALDKAITLGKAYDLELEIITATGAHKWIRAVGSPIVADGKVIKVQGAMQDITQQKADQRKILIEKERFDHLAHYDALTNLPNRLSLDEFMESILPQKKPFAFMFFDLDGFKEINDSYGHGFGDKLLIDVSIMLKKVFPKDAYIVRTGGDEFVIVLPYGDSKKIIDTTMKKVANMFNGPFPIDEKEIYVTTSIGIALFPDDATSTEELLQCADTAMYHAKSLGKNTFSFYNNILTQQAQYRMSISTNLKRAIANQELVLYFQPQVDPSSGNIVGSEALLRWFSPKGAISPADFIPIAEESGLILEIGEFVLKESFKIAKSLADKQLLKGRIAVNVAARQFIHTNFIALLEQLLEETQCHAEWIELEITERSILVNPLKVSAMLEELHVKGFHVSINDFGTGYSSLSYLKNLSSDKLKIDISFIRNITHEPKNQTIVKTIIALARGLNISVIAEGVETLEEMEFLRDNGIDAIQGYYYFKPVALETMEMLLSDVTHSAKR